MVQKHWNIENKLHRNKDVIFNEDKNKVVTNNVAANLSLILNFVLNTITFIGMTPTLAIERFANQIHDTHTLIATMNKFQEKYKIKKN